MRFDRPQSPAHSADVGEKVERAARFAAADAGDGVQTGHHYVAPLAECITHPRDLRRARRRLERDNGTHLIVGGNAGKIIYVQVLKYGRLFRCGKYCPSDTTAG